MLHRHLLCISRTDWKHANFISAIITGDESWVYGYDPETKQQSAQWKMSNSLWPKKAGQIRTNVKSMLFFTLKSSCIRNLFHLDRPWMKTSVATFWGGWGKRSCANIQSSGATIPGPCSMRVCPPTHHSFCGSFWLQRKWQSYSTLPTHQNLPPGSFFISENEIEAQEATFWEHWRDPGWIEVHDEDADTKWLPAVLLNMEIPLWYLY
jgi:hypothetical protein